MKNAISTIVHSFLFTTFLFSQKIDSQLEDYINSHHLEKIYVSHDKPYYIPGEIIWAKVFLLDGITHQAFDAEPLVYVDWIGPQGNILDTYRIKIVEGTAALSIETQSRDSAGIYTIRAYSLYQRNFEDEYLFQKEIQLIDLSNLENDTKSKNQAKDYSLQFFPEGGYLIEGMKCNLAFKVQNDLGEGIPIEGYIIDQNNKELVKLKTWHEGMGRFKIQPELGNLYTAVVNYNGKEKRFTLPPPLKTGYQLEVNTVREDEIVVSVKSNIPKGLNQVQLIGHARGQVFLQHLFETRENQTLVLEKNKMLSGLLHFTLFDPQNRPVAERLAFNHNQQEGVEVEIDLEATSVNQRSQIKGNLTTLQNGNPIEAKASMSIYFKELVYGEVNALNIYSYLLLQSDLRGKISNIGSYFVKNNTQSRTLLDLLLMTHGWRRFNWQTIQDAQTPNIIYPAEEHFTILGKATKADKEKPVKADVTLLILDDENFSSISYTTDESGFFSFSGFDFTDTTEIMIQSNIYNPRKAKKKKEDELVRKGDKYVDLELLRLEAFPFSDSIGLKLPTKSENAVVKEKQRLQQIRQSSIQEGDLWSIELDEVVVSAKVNPGTKRELAVQKRYEELGLFYRHSTQKFEVDDPQFDQFKFRTVFDMIQRIVPRAKIIRENGLPVIIFGRLSARSKCLVALDGQVVPMEFLNTIEPDNIAFIDIMTENNPYDDMSARKIHGASGPLIMLVSKDPSKIEVPRPGVLNFAHPGYYQARTFYTPIYDNSKESIEPDFRTTIFWEPMIDTQNGAVDFECYSGDLSGEYLVWVEGITNSGIPFTGSKNFQIE